MNKVISFLLILILFNSLIIPANATTVPAGKKILITPEKISSKTIKKGDYVFGYVKNDVIVDSKVVIKQGAPAKIYVNDVQKAHRWGVAGYITLTNGTVEDVTGEERDILLDYDVKGNEKDWVKVTAGVCIATIILSPFGFLALIKGGEAEIQPTNLINAELINNFSI